jgi:NAD(P)-dependent dehydrogenase (short-subunit alcohol dehydrogenase family)
VTLTGKTVAITGADGGIGQALCRYFGVGNIVMARELTLEDF